MIETFIIAATTFFATVGPFDVAAIYAALTTQANAAEKRKMAARGVLLAGVILFFFALFGENLLASMGVSLPAFSTAGGILLLLIGIEMVFARHSGAVSTTRAENRDGAAKNDVAVFPLAMPLIAGPRQQWVQSYYCRPKQKMTTLYRRRFWAVSRRISVDLYFHIIS